MKKSIFLFLTAALLTSCYRMPGEDEYSTVPLTNNPDLTREKPSVLPQMGY